MRIKIKLAGTFISIIGLFTGMSGLAQAATSYPSYRFTKTNDVSNGWSNGTASATDSSNNTYTAGIWNGTVKFNPGDNTSSYTPTGGQGMTVTCALTKYNSAGVYQWTKFIDYLDPTNGFDICDSVAVGSNGVVYVGGYSAGSVIYDGPGGTHSYSDTYGGSYGYSYVNEYKTDGSYLKTLILPRGDSSSWNELNTLSVDSNNNLYIGGNIQGNVSFDGTNYNTYSSQVAYTAKYNDQGVYQWVKIADVEPYGFSLNSFITVDKSGNIYTCGQYDNSDNSRYAFLEKLDSQGNSIWVKSVITTGSNQVGCNSIALDSTDNIYVGGFFNGSTTFDGEGGNHTAVTNSDSGFISKYASDGSYQWTRIHIATGEGNYSYINSLVVYNDEIYAVGAFDGTVQFNQDDASTSLTAPNGNYNAYFSGYGQDGSYKFTKVTDISFDGRTTAQYVQASVDGIGNIYIVGITSGTPVFDGPGGIDRQQIGDGQGVTSTLTASYQLAAYPTVTPKTPNTGAGVFNKFLTNEQALVVLSIIFTAITGLLITRNKFRKA